MDDALRSDEALAARLAVDLDGSFEALVAAHAGRLFSIALRFIGDRSDAEEAAQDALVRAYRALAGYDASRIREIRLRPWLATIVLNVCRNRTRVKRVPTVELAFEPSAEPAVDPLARRDEKASWAAAPRDAAAGPAGRRRPPSRRRPVVRPDGRGPRPTRRNPQGPGPSRPGRPARCARRRRTARAGGDDRMNRPVPRPRRHRGRPRDARRAGSAEPRPRRPRRCRPGRRLRADRIAGRAPPGRLERSRRVGGRERRRTITRSRSGSWPGPGAGPMRQGALPAGLARAIERRLAGDRRARIELDLRGSSAFEQAVWLKALEIPRGEVRPYGWVAAEIGRPKAVRAVGTALGHNPVPLIVPCHRVVRSDGTIGQYSLGGPGQQADDPGRRGPRSRRARRPCPSRHPLHRLGYDADLLPADLPQREADHAPPTGCRSARPAHRRRPATGPAASADRAALPSPPRSPRPGTGRAAADGIGAGRRSATLAVLWTIRLCQRSPLRHGRA